MSSSATKHFYINLTALLFLSFILPIQGCEQPRRTAEALFLQHTDELPRYNFRSPDAKYFLPYVLEEISGLSHVSNGVLACIQDEEGKIFLYDHHKKKVIWQERFGSSGDYEGVQVVDDTAFVVNSKGNIQKFPIQDGFHPNFTEKIHTDLRKSNDVEGLTYDAKTHSLIMACKGEAGLKGEKIKGKGFYSYDLTKKKFNKKPLFHITKHDIKNFLEKHKNFEYDVNRINFHPSGIALHPNGALFYIIASTGKLLIIVDRKGQIKGSAPIDPRLLGQPEGICFAPNGDLFISSEGQGDKGYILKFSMK